MNLLKKIRIKLKIESKFLFEQKWGVRKPDDYSIPKYLLKKYISSNPVIVDCGAHVGADSIELARVFPNSTIYSFEPVPDLFKHLKRNTRKFKNIHCHQTALSNKSGFAIMNVSSGASDASSSLLPPSGHITEHPDVLFEKKIEVKTIALDEWALNNKINRIDFLWLDMQGFEYQTLQASKIIFPRVKAIHTEISTRMAYTGSLVYSEFKNWMADNGFLVVMEAIPENSDMGNVLFVRK